MAVFVALSVAVSSSQLTWAASEVEKIDFKPLLCNGDLAVLEQECHNDNAETISSILDNGGTVACGSCAVVDITDGSTITFPSGLNIEGMLYFPSSANVIIEASHIFVQGLLKINPPAIENLVTIRMIGSDDEYLYPNTQNADVCDSVTGCPVGKRAIVIAGGTLDVNGLSESESSCPAWTHLLEMSSPDQIVVGPEAAECWGERISRPNSKTEILVTNSEITSGWDQHFVRQVNAVDVSTGTLFLSSPINSRPITTKIDHNYAAEVAWLSRSVVFESVSDGPDNLHGGHLMVLDTPNVAQRLEGAEFRNFGQQGKVGRYPIHFHMSGSVSGSVVRKNVVRESNQRCVVIHGSHDVLVENNVAYDTHGHCFILEDGGETNNTFKDNLGAKTHNQGLSIGSTDHKAATFWITNTKNHFIGNIAAGSKTSGFWFETRKIRGLSAELPENDGVNPNILPLYTFTDNTAHSNRSFGLNTYDIGYRGSGILQNTKLYKNNIGLFFHGTSGLTVKGGIIADNKLGFLNFANFAPGNIMEDMKIIGTSSIYRDTQCPSNNGIEFSLNARNTQLTLRNTTFEGFSYDNNLSCGDNKNLALAIKEGFHWTPFDMPVFESDVTFDSNKNVFDVRQVFDPSETQQPWKTPWNLFLEDPNGSMNPSGLPGFFVQDATRLTVFADEGVCSPVDDRNGSGSDLKFCKEVCMRRVYINTGCCSEKFANKPLDADFDLLVTSIKDPTKSHLFKKYTKQTGNWYNNKEFELVLPGGGDEYVLEFKTLDGQTAGVPEKTAVRFDELLPSCDGYITNESLHFSDGVQLQ